MGLKVEPRIMDTSQSNRGTQWHMPRCPLSLPLFTGVASERAPLYGAPILMDMVELLGWIFKRKG